MDVTFLSLEQVLDLHRRAIEEHGGSPGLRDMGLLQSAIAVPQQAFGGEYLHPTLAEMVAAYLFHPCMNHPFEDGNKRVAVYAALVFVQVNNLELDASIDELEALTLATASGTLKKPEVAAFFTNRLRPGPRK